MIINLSGADLLYNLQFMNKNQGFPERNSFSNSSGVGMSL